MMIRRRGRSTILISIVRRSYRNTRRCDEDPRRWFAHSVSWMVRRRRKRKRRMI